VDALRGDAARQAAEGVLQQRALGTAPRLAWRLRVSAGVTLALLVALGCGGGSSSPASSGCATQEAFALTQALGGTPVGGLDLQAQVKLCGQARTVAFIFYVTNSLGRIGGPAGGEQQLSTP